MKAEIVNVTPQMAAEWLKLNTNNRPLRRTVVNGLKEALQRGEYIQTHQGIAFSDDGVLLDGQHRLTAISELRDGSFPMLVSWGVSAEAFKVMDIGIKRTASDALGIDRRIVEVARLYAAICNNKKGTITPTQLIPIIGRIGHAHDTLIAFCAASVRTWTSAPVRAAAVFSMLTGADQDYVKATYRALAASDFAAMPPVAHALVRSVNSGVVRATDALDMFTRCMVVFAPRNAAISKIQVRDSGRAATAVRAYFAGAFVSPADSEAGNKKAAPSGAAKSVLRPNYLTAPRGL